MTSEVKELRDYFWHLLHGSDLHKLDVLIITAHAEGVAEGRKEGITKGIARNAYEMGKHEGMAEGAEQMKEKIRDNSLHYRQFDKMDPNIVAGEHNDYAFAQEDLFVVLASVLAPTKGEP